MAFPRRLSHFIRLELDPMDLFEAHELTRRLLFLFPALIDPVGDLGPLLHPMSVAVCTAADARFRERDASARQSFVDYVIALITEARIARKPEVVFGDVVSTHLHAAVKRMTKQLAEARTSMEQLRAEENPDNTGDSAERP